MELLLFLMFPIGIIIALFNIDIFGILFDIRMKSLGYIIVAIAIPATLFAFSIDTTVATSTGRVHNIGKMDERRTYQIASGLLVLVGVILIGFGSIRTREDDSMGNESLDVDTKRQGSLGLYEGDRRLDDASYQLYLVKKFDIEKNNTLEAYVVGNKKFGSLDDALRYAHSEDQGNDDQHMGFS